MNIKDLKIGDKIKSDDRFRHNFIEPDRVWTVSFINKSNNTIRVQHDDGGNLTICLRFEEWQIIKPEITDLI